MADGNRRFLKHDPDVTDGDPDVTDGDPGVTDGGDGGFISSLEFSVWLSYSLREKGFNCSLSASVGVRSVELSSSDSVAKNLKVM